MLKSAMSQEDRNVVWAAIQKFVVESSTKYESVEDIVDDTVSMVTKSTGFSVQDITFTWVVMQVQISIDMSDRIEKIVKSHGGCHG